MDESKTVAIFLLKTGQYLIGEYQELDLEPKIYLTDCYVIEDEEFSKFPKYVSENSCLLNTELILTIGDPSSKVLEKYKQVTRTE